MTLENKIIPTTVADISTGLQRNVPYTFLCRSLAGCRPGRQVCPLSRVESIPLLMRKLWRPAFEATLASNPAPDMTIAQLILTGSLSFSVCLHLRTATLTRVRYEMNLMKSAPSTQNVRRTAACRRNLHQFVSVSGCHVKDNTWEETVDTTRTGGGACSLIKFNVDLHGSKCKRVLCGTGHSRTMANISSFVSS